MPVKIITEDILYIYMSNARERMPHENVKVEMSGWTECSKGEAGDPITSSVFKLLVRRLVCLWFLVMFMTFYSLLLSSVSFSIVYTAT